MPRRRTISGFVRCDGVLDGYYTGQGYDFFHPSGAIFETDSRWALQKNYQSLRREARLSLPFDNCNGKPS
jgi:hypothetical protein